MTQKSFAILALLVAAFASLPLYAEDGYFDSDGVQIRYIESGEGEPVVLIHGFTSTAEGNWVAPGIYAKIAEKYHVIALDNRGHGKSGKPHGAEHYGAKMAKDVVNLLDHLGIEKAHVAGYSLGGFLTLNLIIDHPDRFLSAIIGGAGWRSPDDADLGAPLADSLERGDGFGPLIEALTPEGDPKPSAEMIEGFNRMLSASNDVIALAGVIRGMAEWGVTADEMKNNKVPTIAIVGERDPLKEAADALTGRLGAFSGVEVTPDADHMSAMGHPDFAAAMLKFLDAQGG